MFQKYRNLLFSVLLLSLLSPVFAQNLSITCRCVADGVNSAMVAWIRGYVIPTFEAKHPGVTLSLIEFGGTDEALKEQYALDLSVGAGNDIMAFDGFWVPEFVEAERLKSLELIGGEAAANWEGWSHIPAGLQALMSFGGERYGIAQGTDFRMLYYRKDIFEQAGIANAGTWQPRSWEELLDTARAIKAALPDSVPLQINAGTAMGEATTMQGYYPMLLGTGHFLTDENDRWIVRSQGILDTLNLYKAIYVDEALGDARLQLLQDGRNQSFANFRDGKTAILLEGDFFYRGPTAPGQEFEVVNRDEIMGWAKIPAQTLGAGFRGQDFTTISGGTGFVINPNTKEPALAWDILATMNSREGLMAAQEIQPRIRIRDDVPVPNNAFLTETAAALAPLTTARPNLSVYSEVSFQAQLMTERVISGEMSAEEAMNAYAEAVTDLVGADNVVSLLE